MLKGWWVAMFRPCEARDVSHPPPAHATIFLTFLYVLLYVPIRSGRDTQKGKSEPPSFRGKWSCCCCCFCACWCSLTSLPWTADLAWCVESSLAASPAAELAKSSVPICSCFVLMRFLTVSVRMSSEDMRSYTFPENCLAILAKCLSFLYVPIHSKHVPLRSLNHFEKLYGKYIRSYTFLFRSYTFPHWFRKNVFKSYTFLYVPWNPLAILAKCILFLYVPIRSKNMPLRFLNEFGKVIWTSIVFLYVPIRSKNIPLRFLNEFGKVIRTSYTFLYVPITFLYVHPRET